MAVIFIQDFRDIKNFPQVILDTNLTVYDEDYFKRMWVKMLDAMTRIYKEEDGNICREEVKLVQCPTLVLHGIKDQWILKFHPEFLTKNIKNARLDQLEPLSDFDVVVSLKFPTLFFILQICRTVWWT